MTLLPIGSFARVTLLSAKALRHYHEIGLLVPAEVDPANGYRLYAPSQAEDALLIRRLRNLEMPLEEIGEVLRADQNNRDRIILDHLARLEEAMVRRTSNVQELRAMLADSTARSVEVREIDDLFAVVRRGSPTSDDIAAWCAETYGYLYGSLVAAAVEPVGPSGALYGPDWFTNGEGDVVAFVPVAAPMVEGMEVAKVAGGTYLVATHVGDFADLDRTYAALGADAEGRGATVRGDVREHYVVSPAHTHIPTGWQTEVCWPISTLPTGEATT